MLSKSPSVPLKWTATQMPSLIGKTAIVTGANSGIGYIETLELARHGAHVVMACRNNKKCEDAATQIREILKNDQERSGDSNHGVIECMTLDLSNLKSVEDFATFFLQSHTQLHLLLNNAGVMATPYQLSVDKYESQFATNHLGHFALTARLMDILNRSENARIINVSSLRHKEAKLDLEHLSLSSDNYDKWQAYANSKLCNILFTKELQRRLSASNSSVLAVASHPGITQSNLITALVTQNSLWQRWLWKSITSTFSFFFQTPDMGALPTLYAATAPNVQGGEYYGPNGLLEFWGYPGIAAAKNHSHSKSLAKGLWEKSEQLANIQFNI